MWRVFDEVCLVEDDAMNNFSQEQSINVEVTCDSDLKGVSVQFSVFSWR